MSKILWIILTCIGAVITLVIAAFIVIHFLSGSVPRDEKQDMVSFLSNKYGSDFVVEDISVSSLGAGGVKTFKATAHPTNVPSLKFEISREGNWEKGDYTDNYLGILWSQQARIAVDQLVAQLGGVDRYEVRVGPKGELYRKISGYTPSLTEAQTRYPNEFGYRLILFGSKVDNSSELSEADLTKALTAVNFVKNQKSDYKFLKYSFRDASSAQGASNYVFRIEVEDSDLGAIQSVDNLRAYIKKGE